MQGVKSTSGGYMDNHIRHPEAERSDNTEPQSHLRLLNSREQVKWSASIMLSLNWRNQAFALRTQIVSDMAIYRQSSGFR